MSINHAKNTTTGFSTYGTDLSGNWKLSFELKLPEKAEFCLSMDKSEILKIKDSDLYVSGEKIDKLACDKWQTLEILMPKTKDKILVIVEGREYMINVPERKFNYQKASFVFSFAGPKYNAAIDDIVMTEISEFPKIMQEGGNSKSQIAVHSGKSIASKLLEPVSDEESDIDSTPEFALVDYSAAGWNEDIKTDEKTQEISVYPSENAEKEINEVISTLKNNNPNEQGFKGVICLKSGTYKLNNPLVINTSGIYLKGEEGTVLETGGNAVSILGNGYVKEAGYRTNTVKFYDAGTESLQLEDVSNLRVGNSVWVVYTGAQDGEMKFERKITSIDNDTVTLDVPLPEARKSHESRIYLVKIEKKDFISNIVIENLTVTGSEECALNINKAEKVKINNVSAQGFDTSFKFGTFSKEISAVNCKSVTNGGDAFLICGQRILVENCYANGADKAFSTGWGAYGPNVFKNCISENSIGCSAAYQGRTSGILYENVTEVQNGFAAVDISGRNSHASSILFWNCKAPLIYLNDMNNGAVGLSGVIDNDLIDNSNVVANLNKANVYTNEQYNYLGVPFVGQGYFEAGEYTAEPVSLYEYQNENIMPDAIETVDGKKYAELEKIYIDGKELTDFTKDRLDYETDIIEPGVIPAVSADGDNYKVIYDEDCAKILVNGFKETLPSSYSVMFRNKPKAVVSKDEFKILPSSIRTNGSADVKFICDGDASTVWEQEGNDIWVEFDFGLIKNFSGLNIIQPESAVGASKIKLDFSTDGIVYRNILEEVIPDGENAVNYSFLPISAKYVRIVFCGNGSDYSNRIAEVYLTEKLN